MTMKTIVKKYSTWLLANVLKCDHDQSKNVGVGRGQDRLIEKYIVFNGLMVLIQNF